MQKTALAILLVGFTASVQAEWTKVGTSNLDTNIYFDVDTRRSQLDGLVADVLRPAESS